jgi:hypothetical protein
MYTTSYIPGRSRALRAVYIPSHDSAYTSLKLIIHEENTKKNQKRVVSVYVIQIHVDLHKL